MKKGMNIKGASFLRNKWFWGIVVIAILIYFLVPQTGSYFSECKVTEDEFKAYNESSSLRHPFIAAKVKIFGCYVEQPGLVGNTLGKTGDILGFDRGFGLFFTDLITGALVGLWFWIVLRIARFDLLKFTRKQRLQAKAKYKKLESSWLGILGDSLWKIVPIAIIYAIFMQIPILNTVLEVITFKQLLALKGDGFLMISWNWLIRSFILAFYIGFLPAGIEALARYKIRKRYYEAVMRVKYQGRMAMAAGGSG